MKQDSVSTTQKGDRIVPVAVVAVPVCNEVERVHACLKALAAQIGLQTGAFGIVLFLNNCTDGTSDVVHGFEPMPWPVRILETRYAEASAGWARRMAMDAAAAWLSEDANRDGVLLTTDADSCVGLDWVARNCAALADGAAAVAGRISLDPREAAALPSALHARGRLESAYERLLTEIGALLHPDPSDPWPCHWTDSGATLATRLSVYRRIGGLPDRPQGEDRAFVAAVRAHDLSVRHDPDIEVVTSGRLEGRASGGVADTIKLRCDLPESLCDDRLEPLQHFLRRIFWRRLLRFFFDRGQLDKSWVLALALSISRRSADEFARTKSFGLFMAKVEAASPKLQYSPLRPAELPLQIRRAQRFLRLIRVLTRRVHNPLSSAPPIFLEETSSMATR